MEHAHNTKLRKYEERCNAEAITFLPLAVDTFGGWHKVGLATITKLILTETKTDYDSV